MNNPLATTTSTTVNESLSDRTSFDRFFPNHLINQFYLINPFYLINQFYLINPFHIHLINQFRLINPFYSTNWSMLFDIYSFHATNLLHPMNLFHFKLINPLHLINPFPLNPSLVLVQLSYKKELILKKENNNQQIDKKQLHLHLLPLNLVEAIVMKSLLL